MQKPHNMGKHGFNDNWRLKTIIPQILHLIRIVNFPKLVADRLYVWHLRYGLLPTYRFFGYSQNQYLDFSPFVRYPVSNARVVFLDYKWYWLSDQLKSKPFEHAKEQQQKQHPFSLNSNNQLCPVLFLFCFLFCYHF